MIVWLHVPQFAMFFSVPVQKNVCHLDKKVGSCKASITRWYFDVAANQCTTFTYGGCNGNENNFMTQLKCENKCGGNGKTWYIILSV